MRIAMVSPELGDVPGKPPGGVAAATEWLIRGLLEVDDSLEIHVIRVPSARTDSLKQWGDLPVQIHHISRSRLANQLGILRTGDVDAVLERIRPDVVHVQGHASALDGRKHRAMRPSMDQVPSGCCFLYVGRRRRPRQRTRLSLKALTSPRTRRYLSKAPCLLNRRCTPSSCLARRFRRLHRHPRTRLSLKALTLSLIHI